MTDPGLLKISKQEMAQRLGTVGAYVNLGEESSFASPLPPNDDVFSVLLRNGGRNERTSSKTSTNYWPQMKNRQSD
ncbi:hypothetical protein Trydic_g13079 [Trypoxylus dichotomus]